MRQRTQFFFTGGDQKRLALAMQKVSDVRHYRRLQAVWLVAEGNSAGQAAALLKASRRWVCKCLAAYQRRCCPEDLAEGKHSGRPPKAGGIHGTGKIMATLQHTPLELGYASTVWTAPLLAAHLRLAHGCFLSERTVRRRLHAAGFRWKRPRYVFAQKDPDRA